MPNMPIMMSVIVMVLVLQALMKLWKEHVRVCQKSEVDCSTPEDMMTHIELVLDSHGRFCMQNRLPGENEVYDKPIV